jgi:deoxyribonuclease-4
VSVRAPSPVGAHVKVGPGLAKGALAAARRAGAGALQVFVGNPRGWAPAAGSPGEDEAFAAGIAADGLVAFVHAPYLVNFGSPTPSTVAKSVAATRHALRRAAAIGAAGVVVHTGSVPGGGHRVPALGQVREHLLPLLREIDDLDARAGEPPRLLLEPTAGGGVPLAARVEQLTDYVAALDGHPRLGVCLDTCHAFAAGHDVAAPGGMAELLDALVAAVGQGRLGLVHANDSQDPCGSTRDRHARVGRGQIGDDAFRDLLSSPVTAGVPVVVETGPGPAEHAEDIAALLALQAGTTG